MISWSLFRQEKEGKAKRERSRNHFPLLLNNDSFNSSLEHDESSRELPILIGDKRRLLQVLINLVKNALKFTEEGSIHIQARYDEQSRSFEVAVKDSGVGIMPEDIPNLF